MGWKIEENFETANEVESEISKPLMFKVILLNDDFTTKDFVVEVLMSFFHKKEDEAYTLMETVHRKGSAVAGIYSYDIASTLVARVIKKSRENGFPLRCEMECA